MEETYVCPNCKNKITVFFNCTYAVCSNCKIALNKAKNHRWMREKCDEERKKNRRKEAEYCLDQRSVDQSG